MAPKKTPNVPPTIATTDVPITLAVQTNIRVSIRHALASLLKLKVGVKNRRLTAGWDETYLEARAGT